MGITKIDWKYLCSKHYIIKLFFSIGTLFLLFVSYSLLYPNPAPKEILDQQYETLDYLSLIYKDDSTLDDGEKEKIKDQIYELLMNLGKENTIYIMNEATDDLLPIYEERIELLEDLEGILPADYQPYLIDKSYVQNEVKILRYLVDYKKDYVVYKTQGPFLARIILFLGCGGGLILFCLLTGSYFNRKLSHQSLFEIIPINILGEVRTELLYTVQLFYLLPTIFIMIFTVLYSLLIVKSNLFTYPMFLNVDQEYVVYSMNDLLLSLLTFFIVASIFMFFVQSYLISLVRDSTITTLFIYFLAGVSVVSRQFWLPFAHLFPIPILQSNGNLWLSLGVLIISIFILMLGKITKQKIVR